MRCGYNDHISDFQRRVLSHAVQVLASTTETSSYIYIEPYVILSQKLEDGYNATITKYSQTPYNWTFFRFWMTNIHVKHTRFDNDKSLFTCFPTLEKHLCLLKGNFKGVFIILAF